jgi:transcriptional regulator with XRE-family HTH domain
MLGFAGVPARPIVYKNFGGYLARVRTEHGWTQSDAARKARQRRIPGSPTRQVLLHLEAGKTKNPDPSVLRAISTLYQISYEEVARTFLIEHLHVQADRYGVDVRTDDDGHIYIAEGNEDAASATGGRARDPHQGAPVQSAIAAEDVIDVAADLYAAGARLQRLAEQVLGRHVAIAGDDRPQLATSDSAVRRTHPRKGPTR